MRIGLKRFLVDLFGASAAAQRPALPAPQSPAADEAETARELFLAGHDTFDIGRMLGVPEWQALALLQDARDARLRKLPA